MRPDPMNICVDFDDTIEDRRNIPPGRRMGPPMPGAIVSIRSLVNMGHKIIIFTARDVQKPAVYQALVDWFEFFQIPFHDITNVKTDHMDIFIDNRGVHFDNWPKVMNLLRRLDTRDKQTEFLGVKPDAMN